MEKIEKIEEAKEKVLSDMNSFISSVRSYSENNVSDLSIGIKLLRNIRSSVYENLNQIQHEHLILQGLLWLKDNGYDDKEIIWYWNPRQSGDSSEPDLRAIKNKTVIISAEATTSEKPQGVIDSRMRDTLIKLNTMEGEKYYFIKTESMEKRAKTKISKNGLRICVVNL